MLRPKATTLLVRILLARLVFSIHRSKLDIHVSLALGSPPSKFSSSSRMSSIYSSNWTTSTTSFAVDSFFISVSSYLARRLGSSRTSSFFHIGKAASTLLSRSREEIDIRTMGGRTSFSCDCVLTPQFLHGMERTCTELGLCISSIVPLRPLPLLRPQKVHLELLKLLNGFQVGLLRLKLFTDVQVVPLRLNVPPSSKPSLFIVAAPAASRSPLFFTNLVFRYPIQIHKSSSPDESSVIALPGFGKCCLGVNSVGKRSGEVRGAIFTQLLNLFVCTIPLLIILNFCIHRNLSETSPN